METKISLAIDPDAEKIEKNNEHKTSGTSDADAEKNPEAGAGTGQRRWCQGRPMKPLFWHPEAGAGTGQRRRKPGQ